MTVDLGEAWSVAAAPAPERDREAIEGCVRDYFEGWFDGDAARMARALHPELAKRSFGQTADRAPVLDTASAADMVEATAQGAGRARAGGRPLQIEIVDAGGSIASVVVHTEHYHEYLHVVETPDGWQIVNALWRWSDGHGPRA
jgi:hypothetical protein